MLATAFAGTPRDVGHGPLARMARKLQFPLTLTSITSPVGLFADSPMG